MNELVELKSDLTSKDNEYLFNSDLWKDDTIYSFNGTPVPRVTRIFDTCIGNKNLVNWAARVGYSKMNYYRDRSLAIGTLVHNQIEEYLNYGTEQEPNYNDYDLDIESIQQVKRSFNNFKNWKKNLEDNGNVINKIIGTEVKVTCPWFGGTIDCIMVINGATYIIDFKTSKAINEQYIMQVCAYAWLVNNGYCDICDRIDGVGILRFDKSIDNTFEEYFLNYHIPYQNVYIQRYTSSFFSLLQSFYHLTYIKNLYWSEGTSKYSYKNMSDDYVLADNKGELL